MTIDAPTISYGSDDTQTHTQKKMDELADKWNERRKNSPFKKGQKINLSDYMNQKI